MNSECHDNTNILTFFIINFYASTQNNYNMINNTTK